MFWYDHDFGAWGWIGMTLGMVAFWALLIAAAVWLVRGHITPGGRLDGEPLPDPEQLMAERFARGEIDEAEYRDRLAVMRGESRRVVRS